jgi:hypothetical protein
MLLESSPSPSLAGSLGQPRKHGKRTLARLLRERGAFSAAHAVDVILDICDALAPVHANGVVHGQLGLDSVRLAYPANAGPCDLEIFTLGAEEDSGVAGSLHAPGAPFLGPEHRGHDRPIDARADVWSLGALLYTMLVGSSPPSPAAGPILAPPDSMPLSLAAVVEACLMADPEHRPQTIDEIAERIASFASSPPDRFVCLAARREKRENAERVRRRLERAGLTEMPSVLDKLDDAALARANRNDTTAITSVLIGPSTEAAIQRLMNAVHEGTDAARIELASGLPALVDFDDEDDDVVRTRVQPESAPELPVACPITAPIVLPLAVLAPVTPVALAPVTQAPQSSPPRRHKTIAAVACAALAISLIAGYGGYVLSAEATAPPAVAAQGRRPAEQLAEPVIPVIAASALPEAPITPSMLQEAKR